MKVIKDLQIIEDNWFVYRDVDEETAVSDLPAGDILLPFPYWLSHREALNQRSGEVGIIIDGSIETEDLVEYLDSLPLIALDFPTFADGRSYSHARILRDRYHFPGELRAVGDILRDQLYYMHRCGVDSFALREDKDFTDALAAFKEFTVTYQTAADGAQPVYRLR